MPLQGVPVPPVPGLVDGPDPIVVDKAAAIALGKALFWDVGVGSDGMACASCHFHAGADPRVTNQINPGEKSSAGTGQSFEALPSGGGGANYTLTQRDFPTFQFNDPLDSASGVKFATDDVIASSGTFSGKFVNTSSLSGTADVCERTADPVFHVNSIGTRRVEPRNAPTVINTVFNHRNFWDGRANNIFNGSSPWGDRDPNAGVWVKVNAREVVKTRLRLENSSLASLATAPPLSDSEMACRQRNWSAIGRKLLLRRPLQDQKVHPRDSVLGPLSRSTAAQLQTGLNTTYKALITKAFNPKYWSYARLGPFGAPIGQVPYNQAEANFVMFFGIALQLYQSTLISDQAPIDLSPRDPLTFQPTWEGMGKSETELAYLGFGVNVFESNHCNLCHAGPLLTTAAIVTNSQLVTPTPGAAFGPEHFRIPFGPNALGPNKQYEFSGISPHLSVVTRDGTIGGTKLMDLGFFNTGVVGAAADPGVGGLDDFGNPLSFAEQYVQYLQGNNAKILDPGVNTSRSCDFLRALANGADRNSTTVFTARDGTEQDGSREGQVRDKDCIFPSQGFIPTLAAARAAVTAAPAKLAVASAGVFKVPTLRNIELTGPYMHNGGMATLDQVLEFYTRKGNINNPNKHFLINNIRLDADSRLALIAFMKSFTDERVRYERAPFDHPEIAVPDGHVGNPTAVTAGNALHPGLAADRLLRLPAVGAEGSAEPLRPFDANLAP